MLEAAANIAPTVSEGEVTGARDVETSNTEGSFRVQRFVAGYATNCHPVALGLRQVVGLLAAQRH
jgi:hypothetical protein